MEDLSAQRAERLQQIQLELMRLATFAQFDGESVTRDLEANRPLWCAALMVHSGNLLIPLRDLPQGIWNVNTLFVMSSGTSPELLKDLATTWGASAVRWLDHEEVQTLLGIGEYWRPEIARWLELPKPLRVLRVVWS